MNKFLDVLKFKRILLAVLIGFGGFDCLWAVDTPTNTPTNSPTNTPTVTPNPTDDWPMFKNGGLRSGIAPLDSLSTPFVLKWYSSSSIGSANAVAYSSPIMLNSHAYIGSIDGTLFA